MREFPYRIAATDNWRAPALIRKRALPDRDRELCELAGEIYVLRPRPLYELLRKLDAGALLRSLRSYADLLPLAAFIERLCGRDLS
jgi:hypothetical protein